MSRNRTHRPRISRDRRDRVVNVAERLNGSEVSGFHEALGLLVRYLDVLQKEVDACPECGGTDLRDGLDGNRGWIDLPDGKWYCPDCDTTFSATDYVAVDDPEAAQYPGVPKHVQARFECNHEDHEAGTKSSESAQTGGNQAADGYKTPEEQLEDKFEW